MSVWVCLIHGGCVLVGLRLGVVLRIRLRLLRLGIGLSGVALRGRDLLLGGATLLLSGRGRGEGVVVGCVVQRARVQGSEKPA